MEKGRVERPQVAPDGRRGYFINKLDNVMQDLLSQFSENFPILFAFCKWLLMGLGLGAFAFCFNHFLKGKIIDKRCKPVFCFQNIKGKSLSLSKKKGEDIEIIIKEELSQEKEKLLKQFPKKNLDPYIDPFLTVETDRATASKVYNMEIEKYIPARLFQLEGELRFNAISKYLEKVSFCIENNGSLNTKNATLEVVVSSTGPMVYQNTVIKESVGEIPEKPSYTPEYGLANLLVPATSKQYKYCKFDLSSANIFHSAKLNIPDIVPGVPDVSTFPELFVDTRVSGTVTVRWNIHESTMKAKGIKGVLTINVN